MEIMVNIGYLLVLNKEEEAEEEHKQSRLEIIITLGNMSRPVWTFFLYTCSIFSLREERNSL